MKRTFFLLGLVLLLVACGKGDQVMARAAGNSLTMKQMRSWYPAGQWEKLTPSDIQRDVQHWVDLNLLAAQCDSLGYSQNLQLEGLNDIEVLNRKANYYLQILLTPLVVDDEVARVYFSQNFTRYQDTNKQVEKNVQEYNVQVIYTSDPNKFQTILGALNARTKFDEVARAYSEKYNAENGGYLGWVSEVNYKSLLPEESMWNTVTMLQPYYWKIIPASGGGNYIVSVAGTRENTVTAADVPSYDNLSDAEKQRIKDIRLKEMRETRVKKELERLQSSAEILVGD